MILNRSLRFPGAPGPIISAPGGNFSGHIQVFISFFFINIFKTYKVGPQATRWVLKAPQDSPACWEYLNKRVDAARVTHTSYFLSSQIYNLVSGEKNQVLCYTTWGPMGPPGAPKLTWCLDTVRNFDSSKCDRSLTRVARQITRKPLEIRKMPG